MAREEFSITPQPCYRIDAVIVDNTPVSPVPESYTFTGVDAPHTIEVRFAAIDCGTPQSLERRVAASNDDAEQNTLVPTLDSMVVARLLPAPAVAHTLRAVADRTRFIVKLDETNNAATVDVSVGAPPTAVDDVPVTLALSAPHPNPASGAVSMRLDLPESDRVELEVFDLQGRPIRRPPARAMSAGRWTLTWPGTHVDRSPARPGVYLTRVTIGERAFHRRIVRVR